MSDSSFLLLYMILLPAAAALLALLAPAKWAWIHSAALVLGCAGNLVVNIMCFGKTLNFVQHSHRFRIPTNILADDLPQKVSCQPPLSRIDKAKSSIQLLMRLF